LVQVGNPQNVRRKYVNDPPGGGRIVRQNDSDLNRYYRINPDFY
jgi:hypothetical protein